MGMILSIVAIAIIGIVFMSDPAETTKLLSTLAVFMLLVVGVGKLDEYLQNKREE